ncbi:MULTISPECIES: helix-turn-helix transcriptional regulator [Rhodococcus]|nr:helix-turn-helix domain-containing protein [Rhodococcus qingshengii]
MGSQTLVPVGQMLVADAEQYLTTEQVSARTGLPTGTLRYWRHVGDGPESFKLGRKRVVYKLSTLMAWLDAQEAAGTRRQI